MRASVARLLQASLCGSARDVRVPVRARVRAFTRLLLRWGYRGVHLCSCGAVSRARMCACACGNAPPPNAARVCVVAQGDWVTRIVAAAKDAIRRGGKGVKEKVHARAHAGMRGAGGRVA